MIRPSAIDELTDRIVGLLPDAVRHFQEDSRQHLRLGVKALLQRMDLVTREEFDIQKAVLARTREKLEVLEQQVAALERESKNR